MVRNRHKDIKIIGTSASAENSRKCGRRKEQFAQSLDAIGWLRAFAKAPTI
jgi:hypothetical protein